LLATTMGPNWRSRTLLSGNREISRSLKRHFPRLSKSPRRKPYFMWPYPALGHSGRHSLVHARAINIRKQVLSCGMWNKSMVVAWRFLTVSSLENSVRFSSRSKQEHGCSVARSNRQQPRELRMCLIQKQCLQLVTMRLVYLCNSFILSDTK
jgi:hypothetical protein